MESKSLKNIESLFRQIRLFGIVFLLLCAAITTWSVWNSYRLAERKRERVYVLGNGRPLMLISSQDLSQNRPVEAKEHVRRFRELPFTLSPEKSAIEHNVKHALLLADKSAYSYYSDFAERGYCSRIAVGNINQVLKVDSVVCDFSGYSYRAVTYATRKVIRQSNVTKRNLVTTCRLLNSSRSDDDPDGFTIEGFTIIENKDLRTIGRQTGMKKIKKSFWGVYWKLYDKKKILVARLRGYLNGLPPKTRRCIVLAIFTTFATLALYTFGRAVCDTGRNGGSRMVTDHAGQAELSVQQETENHLIPYLYGTDGERNKDRK